MSFENVKKGDEVYGTVFGLGRVIDVLPKDSFYTFEVEYAVNGQRVHYTSEGVPNWGNIEQQTVFYKSEIDLVNYDFSPSEKKMKPKKLLKLKMLGRLEIKCPSGIWRLVKDCPIDVEQDYVLNERFHLFREIEPELGDIKCQEKPEKKKKKNQN